MKRKLVYLLGIMMLIAAAGAMIIVLVNPKVNDMATASKKDKLQVLATFYPVYLTGINLAEGLEGVEVKSLTELNTGCLHDYQLTTQDMKLISNADVLVINGGGMEGFLEDISKNYPDLTIIDVSNKISMFKNTSGYETDNHVNEEAGNEDTLRIKEEYNAHVWLDPQLYMKQIDNFRDGLINYIEQEGSEAKYNKSELKAGIEHNAQVYMNKVKKLDRELEDIHKGQENWTDTMKKAVIFHDSFAYLADRAGIPVAFAVPLDSDTALSSGEIAAIVDAVKEKKIGYLFTEEQYSDSIARQIEAETVAKVYIIDSVVTGDGSKDAYLKAMSNNLKVIKEALQ